MNQTVFPSAQRLKRGTYMARLFQKITSFSLPLRTLIILYSLLITVPLSVLLVWFNASTLADVQEQILQVRRSLLELHGERMDQLLQDIDGKITVTFRDQDLELTTLASTRDEFSYALARSKMIRVLNRWLEQYSEISVVFLYLPERDDYLAVARMGVRYELRAELENYVRQTVVREDSPRHWQGAALCGGSYLVDALPFPRIWMGACLNGESLLAPMSGTSIPEAVELSTVFPGNVTGSVLNLNSAAPRKDDIFLTVPSQAAGYEFRLRLNQVNVWDNLSAQQTVLLVLTGLLIILSLLLIAQVSWRITSPLRRMVSVMENMLEGNWDSKTEVEQGFHEMRILQETFNEMSQEIKNLKISIYEERLSSQQTQLHYAQMKAKPHFYLNCLNIVYNLAALGELEKVKKVSHMLMQSFRFILNSDEPFVRLKEELANVENYVELQKIRYPRGFEYRCLVEPGLEAWRVPPMLLLPLVENSFKYAIDPDREIVIELKAFLQEDKIHLVVRDGGAGYPDKILRAFSQNRPIAQEGRACIGLTNIRQRLCAAYGEEGSMEIGNLEQGGAWTELSLPKQNIEHALDEESGGF